MTIIFDDTITGHHLEFLSHYYTMAVRKKDDRYCFILPKEFETEKSSLGWTDNPNITVRYLSDDEKSKCKKNNVFVAAWNKSRLVAKEARKLKADRIILTMLIEFMPFLLFMLPKHCVLSGILYRIYLRDDNMKGIRLLLEKLRFLLMATVHRNSMFYILNDRSSTDKLNKIYKTMKFKFLPDPVPHIDVHRIPDIRERLGISESKYIYLHFGGLTRRKGTLEIMKAIVMADRETLSDKYFIFAGKIYDDIKKEFYTLYDKAKQKTDIIVFDQFCPYSHLYQLCQTCDCILMPYTMVNLSSGILGYAAIFNKPVIGPHKGLLGELIHNYHLGTCIKRTDASNLVHILNKTHKYEPNNYAEERTVENFIHVLSEIN